MRRYFYAVPWRLKAVADRDCDRESFLRRKSCRENSEGNGRQKCWRKARGPHTTAKPQTAMRCDKGRGRCDFSTPLLPLLLPAGTAPLGDRDPVRSQKAPKALPNPRPLAKVRLNSGQMQWWQLVAWVCGDRLEEGGTPLPMCISGHAESALCPYQRGREGNLNKQGPSDGNFYLKATIWREII